MTAIIMLQSGQPSSHFGCSFGSGVQGGGVFWTKPEFISMKTRSERVTEHYPLPDSVGATKVFRSDGCQRGANLFDDLRPAKRLRGAGFVQMRFNKLRVKCEGAVGELK